MPVKEGKYIYCIIAADKYQIFGECGIGGRGDKLYTICFNELAAVVSDSPVINYSVSKVNLLSHTKAIELVMGEFTVLPVRFSTIAEDENKVKKILEKEYDKFKSMITKLEGKKELGLKAVLNSDVIYKDILEKHKDINMLKKKLERSKAYNELVEIGEMVENALEAEKEIYKEEILNTLSPLAEEISINKVFEKMMVLNAAFLVEKNREAKFDQNIHELDSKFSSKIKFKYVGTVPPFNFVNLKIETRNY
ncbi:MAG: GvpL/GvpF family gas vesicle protein [Ignavibacteriales bacterium]|nr:GvpL/GvpF family gas vesicle protein [Ignavibacteriales bacterium]